MISVFTIESPYELEAFKLINQYLANNKIADSDEKLLLGQYDKDKYTHIIWFNK